MTLVEIIQGCRVALHHGEIGIALDDHIYESLERELGANPYAVLLTRGNGGTATGPSTTILLGGGRYFRRSHVR